MCLQRCGLHFSYFSFTVLFGLAPVSSQAIVVDVIIYGLCLKYCKDPLHNVLIRSGVCVGHRRAEIRYNPPRSFVNTL